jgi:uncharacterized protein YbaR (Trm112 family)/SAM-dependent methyltransferase
MRYSFLDLLACPITGDDLSLIAVKEVSSPIPEPYCPAPRFYDPEKNRAVEIDTAILISQDDFWYPVIDGIPEILPDRLRDWDRDLDFARSIGALKPGMEARARDADRAAQVGDGNKIAEITLLDKVENKEAFLGPGRLSPFNPYAFNHSSELVRGFACCIPFMKLQLGNVVLDSGSGYSWTTEWFMKMGIRAVGVEINRTYLETGRQRMSVNCPELVIADAENLPFRNGIFDSALGFDAFHHIPNRERAMEEFARVLKSAGTITLVEPGEAHEADPVAIEVMAKYGTLERGMNLDDVCSYVAGLPFHQPREHFLIPAVSGQPMPELSRDFIGWSLFTTERN